MFVADATLPDGRTADVRIEAGERSRRDREPRRTGRSDGERIDAVGDLDPRSGERVVDASGLRLFPGAIDVHVHFREPGAPHKETWATGSRSAAAGGVTTVVDQPNTDPPTVTGGAVDEKETFAERSVVDYGLNGGATADWEPDTLFERPLFALGEVFLADSTGDMGIDEALFAAAVERAAAEDVAVTVHAEDASLFDADALPDAGDAARASDAPGSADGALPTGRDADADAWSAYRRAEAEVAAVERALAVAEEHGAAVHVAHTSTPEGIDRAAEAGATCEVTPHHLYLSRDDASELGTYGRMNPPLRSEERRAAVYERLRDGTVDVVATDHAPHTVAEKEAALTRAPSGVPGVETMLPLLLADASEGRLSYERVRDVVAANPAERFALPEKGRIEPGSDADLVLVDPDRTREIRGEQLHSECGWTPFEGREAVFPLATLVRGEVAYADPEADVVDEIAPADGPFGAVQGRNVRE